MRRPAPSTASARLPGVAAALAALPFAAHATVAIPIPEPSSWWLLGVAGVAAVVTTIRNRRK